MNWAYFHVVSAHIPVVALPIFSAILCLGIFFKKRDFQHLALITILLTSVFSVSVFLSGEEAEHFVEDLPRFSHEVIEEHEEKAETTFYSFLVLGLLSLITLILSLKSQTRLTSRFSSITLIFCLVQSGLFLWTAQSGGKISHTEFLEQPSQTLSKH